jgi:type IV pilus assembly protein PilV
MELPVMLVTLMQTKTILKNVMRKIGFHAHVTEQPRHDRQTDMVVRHAQRRRWLSSVVCQGTAITGFTLIELMVAMLIMMVGLMGLLSSLIVARDHNTKNLIRYDVVQVAENTMNAMKNQPLTAAFTPVTTVTSAIRGVPKQYSVRRQTTTLPSGGVQYQVAVTSAYKNLSTTHTIVSIRGKQ